MVYIIGVANFVRMWVRNVRVCDRPEKRYWHQKMPGPTCGKMRFSLLGVDSPQLQAPNPFDMFLCATKFGCSQCATI